MQVAERAGGPEDAANDATDAEDDATLHVAREFIMAELLLRADVHEDRHRDAGARVTTCESTGIRRVGFRSARAGEMGAPDCDWHAPAKAHRPRDGFRGAAWTAP